MALFQDEQSGAYEVPSDAGKGKPGQVKRWFMEIDLASKNEREWRRRARDVVARFRAGDAEAGQTSQSPEFNILWSNTEVMRPVLYNSTPEPDVRRKWRAEDDTGKRAAVVLERALKTVVDSTVYDFDHVMNLAVLDVLLPGRAVTRVRYEPKLRTVEPEPIPVMDEFGELVGFQEAEPYDEIIDQAVECEHVQWADFRHGPGKTWADVEWVAFRHALTRDQLREKFPGVGGSVEMSWDVNPENDRDQSGEVDPSVFKRAEVWEIWDKTAREVLFIARSYEEKPLRVDDDPLGLAGFFPIPRPLYAVETSDSLIPIELYSQYRDQAKELDRITARINGVVSALKMRGVYDSTISAMKDLEDATDGQFIPVSGEALSMLQTGGSLDRAIWMMPVEQGAQVLTVLYQQRAATMSAIYEITGLSDIMRGQSDPRETRGAQELKAQTGSRRMRKLQRDVQRYVRDLFRMAAEIMSEHFEPHILSTMTGSEVTPEIAELLASDVQRTFRIDIETDSTIGADDRYDQEALLQLLGAVGQYVQVIGPTVQAGYLKPKAAVSLLQSVLGHFRLGRKLDDVLDETEREAEQQGAAGPQEQPNPEAEKMQADLQMRQIEMQMKQAEFEAEQARKDQAAAADIERKNAEAQARIEIEREKALAHMQVTQAKAAANG